MGRRITARLLLAAGALAAVAVYQWRILYGIDFTDESWYVAVAYRFLLGGRPYVEELSVPQTTAAILLTPPLALYRLVAGRSGIVLFVRELHLLVSAGAALAVYLSLRRLVGRGVSFLAALAAFVFAPFDIPSVGYDSLGSSLFTAGTLLALAALERPRMRPLAGVCLGLAAFVYPPLLIAVVAAAAVWVYATRAGGWTSGARLALPALVLPLAAFVALGLLEGPHQVVADYRRSSHYLGQAGGLRKLQGIAAHLRDTLPHWYLLAAALLLAAASWRRWPRLAALAVCVLPLTTLPSAPSSYSASLNYVAHAGFLAAPLLLGLRDHTAARRVLLVVWLPALVGGVVTSYSSANGGVNFGVGFFPAVVATAAVGCFAVARLWPSAPWLRLVPGCALAALLLYMGLVPVYRDAPLSRLDARVSSGPYAGLVTSSAKRAFLDRLTSDLHGVGSRCTIAFFNDFPGGYLLTSARPDTNAVWTATVAAPLTFAYHRDLVDYWRAHGFPDVAVEMLRIPFASPRSARRERYAATDPIVLALHGNGYRLEARRLDYLVYRRARC